MPNRILREGILTSDRVEQLDYQAEVFYRRLMSKVDDHGLFDARPSILRSSLYPLRVDRVREADIARWLVACETAGVIALYQHDGRPFLRMVDTRWQARSEAKFPLPNAATNSRQMPADANSCLQVPATAHLDVDVVVVGDVVVDEGKALSSSQANVDDAKSGKGLNGRHYGEQARELLEFLNAKTGRYFRPTEATLRPIVARLKEGHDLGTCKAVIVRRWRDWKDDDKMRRFLRPATLFGAEKFAQYVGEVPTAEAMERENADQTMP